MQPTPSTPMVVIDASVVVKWYLLDEESPEDALSLRTGFLERRFSIAVPEIIRYEMANAVNVARRRGRIDENTARQAVADFLSWDFTYVGTNELILAAVDAARRFDCALYDALYLALAESIGCDLITADRVLLAKAQPAAPWVRWLGDDRV